MNFVLQDIRYALRTLRKSPGFVAAAVATLAVGIGANTAIFSVVRGVILASLPYRDVGSLVRIGHLTAESNRLGGTFSPQDFDDLGSAHAGLSAVAAYQFVPGLTGLNLIGRDEPRRLNACFVSARFFETLGSSAAQGRTLAPSENVPGRDNVVVVSDRIRRLVLGVDRAAVGRTLDLDGKPFIVVGVMPAAFQFPDVAVDVWVPLSLLGENEVPHRRAIRWLSVVARLDPKASAAGVRAALDAFFRELEAKYPDSNRGFGRALVVPLERALLGEVRTPLLILLGAVSLVLLIACANVANLLLARATARRREIAIRLALGASPGRIVRQLLAESALLALAGGALGLLAAVWGIEALLALAAGRIPRADQVSPDAAVAAFSFGLSVATGVLFGLFPAWRAARPDVARELESGGRGGTGSHAGPRKALVVAETVLAVVLLSGAGLLVKSLWRLMHVATGVAAERVLALSITVPDWKYPTDERAALYRAQLLHRLRALPGVVAVGGSKTMPLSGGGEPYGFTIERRNGTSDHIRPSSGALIVTSGYFEALGIPILRGRAFVEQDLENNASVMVINQTLARELWPREDAVGKRVSFGPRIPEMEIIGIAADVRNEGLREEPAGTIYVPISIFQRSTLKIFLRTQVDPRVLIPAARAAIRHIDPDQPISEIRPLTQAISESASRPRFYAWMLALFAALALTLAGSGLYAILSYGIAQRRREIGVRLALGAQRRDVLSLVLRDGLGAAAIGTLLGLAFAAAASRVLASLLYEVRPLDPEVFAAVPLFLLIVATLASLRPALRASRTDPIEALRSE